MAKILLYDIEVSREVAEGYTQGYEFKVVKLVRHQTMMCYAYKWLGEKKIHYVSLHDFKTHRELVQSLHDLQSQADICVAHNGDRFDNKMMNRFYIKEGLDPVPNYKSVDTLKVARANFRFQSNRLNAVCEYLDIGVKSKITYADIETEFLENPNRKVEKLMRIYNEQDVRLLEALYLKLRPFMPNHPAINVINNDARVCPKCGAKDTMHISKHRYTKTGRYIQYQCIKKHGGCGGYSSSRVPDPQIHKMEYTN